DPSRPRTAAGTPAGVPVPRLAGEWVAAEPRQSAATLAAPGSVAPGSVAPPAGGENGAFAQNSAGQPEIELGPTIDSYAAALIAADAARGDTEVVLVVRDGVTRREDAARASLLL